MLTYHLYTLSKPVIPNLFSRWQYADCKFTLPSPNFQISTQIFCDFNKNTGKRKRMRAKKNGRE